MKKKLIITESQLTRLKKNIITENTHSSIVKKIKEELDANYLKSEKFVKEGGDYNNKLMFEIKADGEVISAESLCEYLTRKYKTKEDFTQQVIKDWVDGKITEHGMLSKNVTPF